MRIGEIIETAPNGSEIRRAVLPREKGKPVAYFVWSASNPRVQRFEHLLAAQIVCGTVTVARIRS